MHRYYTYLRPRGLRQTTPSPVPTSESHAPIAHACEWYTVEKFRWLACEEEVNSAVTSLQHTYVQYRGRFAKHGRTLLYVIQWGIMMAGVSIGRP